MKYTISLEKDRIKLKGHGKIMIIWAVVPKEGNPWLNHEMRKMKFENYTRCYEGQLTKYFKNRGDNYTLDHPC